MKVRVKATSPFHPNRLGYLTQSVLDSAVDIIVLSSEPENENISIQRDNIVYFAIHKDFLEILDD